ncbi:hypothetical protein HYPGJ_20338 [Hyphomicrobium sp. GJ21]|nr:hypothetical protein HYPGJ_20338 [Hyphomicrobium sp. GJ21]
MAAAEEAAELRRLRARRARHQGWREAQHRLQERLAGAQRAEAPPLAVRRLQAALQARFARRERAASSRVAAPERAPPARLGSAREPQAAPVPPPVPQPVSSSKSSSAFPALLQRKEPPARAQRQPQTHVSASAKCELPDDLDLRASAWRSSAAKLGQHPCG